MTEDSRAAEYRRQQTARERSEETRRRALAGRTSARKGLLRRTQARMSTPESGWDPAVARPLTTDAPEQLP